jgi:O-antigen/teichoic acid export membrane protein
MSPMLGQVRKAVHSAAKWGETYTRTDMLYVVHGGFWLTLAKVVGMLTSLVVATALANLIPPEVFGTYRFVLSGAAILGAFTLTGMSSAITQAVARGYEGSLKRGVTDYLSWSTGMVALSIAVAVYYFFNDNYVLAISFLIVAGCNPLLNAFSLFSQFLSGKKDFRTQAFFESIADIVPAIALVLAVFVSDNPLIIVGVSFVSGIIINVILHVFTLWKYRPNDSVDVETLPFVKHLSFMGVLGKIGENIDKVLVFHYLGAASLAMYAFAQTPVAQLKLFADIPVRIALPKLSERNYDELRTTLPRKTFILVGAMCLIALTYAVLAPFLFSLLFPQYVDAVIYTQVLAFSLAFTPSAMFASALTAHMKTRELYTSQAVLPFVKIGLFLALLPPFGIWGAIAATLFSQVLTFILFGYLFWRAR